MKTKPWIALGAAMLLVACAPREPEGKASDQGRPETKAIEAADPLGYEGKAIRKKVDQALDANDQRKDQLDRAIDQQSR